MGSIIRLAVDGIYSPKYWLKVWQSRRRVSHSEEHKTNNVFFVTIKFYPYLVNIGEALRLRTPSSVFVWSLEHYWKLLHLPSILGLK
jgi:hypothetical protein